MHDLGGIERRLQLQHRLLGGLQHRIQAAQDRHRQDHVAVFAAHIQIPEHVVGDAPDEVGDPGELALFHHSSAVLRVVAVRSGCRKALPWSGCTGFFTGLPACSRASRKSSRSSWSGMEGLI